MGVSCQPVLSHHSPSLIAWLTCVNSRHWNSPKGHQTTSNCSSIINSHVPKLTLLHLHINHTPEHSVVTVIASVRDNGETNSTSQIIPTSSQPEKTNVSLTENLSSLFVTDIGTSHLYFLYFGHFYSGPVGAKLVHSKQLQLICLVLWSKSNV